MSNEQRIAQLDATVASLASTVTALQSSVMKMQAEMRNKANQSEIDAISARMNTIST